MKLLLVEDNNELARWIVELLRAVQFVMDCVPDAERAESMLAVHHYDAVLLDLRLPGMSGADLLIRLRRRQDTVPVLVLTANDSIDDKVKCLSAGADDYVVKPFDARELVARIKAVIRRHASIKSPAMCCGDLAYDASTRQFALCGASLPLRRREHAILEALILKQGRTVSRSALMDAVFSLDDEPSKEAIDTYIHRLRRHLAASTAEIVTLRGLGYLMQCKAESA